MSTNYTPILLELTTNLLGKEKLIWTLEVVEKLTSAPAHELSVFDCLTLKENAGEKSPEYVNNLRDFIAKHRTKAVRTQVVLINNLFTIPLSVQTIAQNILLKTLEEPPTNTLFVVVCDNLGQVLDTIKSRCNIKTEVNYQFIPEEMSRVEEWWQLDTLASKKYHELIKIAADLLKKQAALLEKKQKNTPKVSDLTAARLLILDLLYYSNYRSLTPHVQAKILKHYRFLAHNTNAKLTVESLLFSLKEN